MKKMMMLGALLVASMLCAGCAQLDEANQDPEANVSTAEQDSVVWCSGKVWRVDFYAEPQLIHNVGFIACTSCYGQQTSGGLTSNYSKLAHQFTCEPPN